MTTRRGIMQLIGKERKLAVVYRKEDELIVNMLKKLVETNDDGPNGQIIGTEDGTVGILPWTEDVWLKNKKAGNRKEKLLFINRVEGVEQLEPIIDVKFDKFGVKYGFSGKQALIMADSSCLKNQEILTAFKSEISTLSSIPSTGRLPDVDYIKRAEHDFAKWIFVIWFILIVSKFFVFSFFTMYGI